MFGIMAEGPNRVTRKRMGFNDYLRHMEFESTSTVIGTKSKIIELRYSHLFQFLLCPRLQLLQLPTSIEQQQDFDVVSEDGLMKS